MTLSKWQAQLETMLMALMAYLQHLSLEQLQDEILLTTSAVIVKLSAQGFVDINKLTQRIDGIRIECKDLSANCSVESSIGAPHF
jgi:hypothetical protein